MLKPESGKRKAKTRGVKKAGREEQEDGEGKKEPLTAAPAALRFLLSAYPISAFPHARPRTGQPNPQRIRDRQRRRNRAKMPGELRLRQQFHVRRPCFQSTQSLPAAISQQRDGARSSAFNAQNSHAHRLWITRHRANYSSGP